MSRCRPRRSTFLLPPQDFLSAPRQCTPRHIRPRRTRWVLIEPPRSRTATGRSCPAHHPCSNRTLGQSWRWKDSSLLDRGTGSTSAPADDAPPKRYWSGRQNTGRRSRNAISGSGAEWCQDLASGEALCRVRGRGLLERHDSYSSMRTKGSYCSRRSAMIRATASVRRFCASIPSYSP